MEKKLYYFGCLSKTQKGHYLYRSEGSSHGSEREAVAVIPNLSESLLKALDTTFAPNVNGYQKEGLYNDCVVPPVRIVAWWDRSADDRGNSNSALMGYGYDNAEQMIDDACIKFPSVMGRQKRPVSLLDVKRDMAEIKLRDKVITEYYENEVFEVVGMRAHDLELKGDWSGGTHSVCQTSWYPKEKCKKA